MKFFKDAILTWLYATSMAFDQVAAAVEEYFPE